MKVCNKQDFFEWIKVTEAHPNKYYFERIDVFDNALVRSFLPPPGAGVTSLWWSQQKTGGPFRVEKRKIHRPGVPELTAQNEQGEDEGIGVNAPVPFVFPETNQSVWKSLLHGTFRTF